EARIAAENDIAFESVAVGKVRRAANPIKMLSRENVRDMANVPRGVAQARSLISECAPDVVLATGGYVAVPVGLAAALSCQPLVGHEHPACIGLANKVLARPATSIAVASRSATLLLPGSAGDRAVVTGNPGRPEVLSGRADRAPEWLGFRGYTPDLPTVYV